MRNTQSREANYIYHYVKLCTVENGGRDLYPWIMGTVYEYLRVLTNSDSFRYIYEWLKVSRRINARSRYGMQVTKYIRLTTLFSPLACSTFL